jgi:hypothetical protein
MAQSAPRPTEITCSSCGVAVPVKPKGRIPTACADCRNPKAAPEPLDDGWPQRIAPCAWLDQDGNRWTDMGEAYEAAQRIRERG